MYKIQQGQHSFFGNFLYERAVSKNHFLRQLSQVVDLSFIDELCRDLYHQEGAGQRPYAPSFLFKGLLLGFLYSISDRDLEAEINDRLSFKWFLGLAVDEDAPDHSTWSVFRERLGSKRFRQIFNQIVAMAAAAGFTDDKLRIIDATHSEANVDVSRIHQTFEERSTKEPKSLKQEGLTKDNYVQKLTTDPDAARGHKSATQSFYGYKHHWRRTGTGIIDQVEVTPGNVHDAAVFSTLVADLEGDPSKKGALAVTADKAYDDEDHHILLQEKHCASAIIVRNYVGRKEKLIPKKFIPRYTAITKCRAWIERDFGEAKQWHGLRKARWRGKGKVEIQSLMTAITLNLKRMTCFGLSPPRLQHALARIP